MKPRLDGVAGWDSVTPGAAEGQSTERTLFPEKADDEDGV